MQADLQAALDAFDRVVASAAEMVPKSVLDPIAQTVRNVRDRAGYLGDTLVVAIAGGTGSGKSSLVNAFAREVVTESGGMRPTTGLPLAWIPENPEPGLMRLLDDLGVDARVGQDLYPWLALVDLPDTDSVVVEHRHTVEALLPRVDLVLWVIDPEKYQDRVLHDRYLKPLAAYHRQFLFVLNQIDRLEARVVTDIVDDLADSLRLDGIPDPRVLAVAADPTTGPPMGVDELVLTLEATIDVKRTVFQKLATDLVEAARVLAAMPELSGGVGFGPRWDQIRMESAEMIASGDRRGAEAKLGAFVEVLADEVGGEPARALRNEAGRAVSAAVAVAYESSGAFRRPAQPPPKSWVRPVRWMTIALALAGILWSADSLRGTGSLLWPVAVVLAAVATWVGVGVWSSHQRDRAAWRASVEHQRELVEPVARHLDVHLGKPLRSVLRRRAGVTAAATELNLALADLERRLGLD